MASLNFAIGLPETVKLGEYNLSLRLSDPEERLEDRFEYAVQLANKGLWDARAGLHDLYQCVVVTSAKPSVEYKGKLKFREINPK